MLPTVGKKKEIMRRRKNHNPEQIAIDNKVLYIYIYSLSYYIHKVLYVYCEKLNGEMFFKITEGGKVGDLNLYRLQLHLTKLILK